MKKAIDQLTASIRSTKENFDGELQGYLYNMLSNGDISEERNAFGILAEETLRELSQITSFHRLEPSVLQHLKKLLRELKKFDDSSKQKRKALVHCLAELHRLVRLMRSGRTPLAVDEEGTKKQKRAQKMDWLDGIYEDLESWEDSR